MSGRATGGNRFLPASATVEDLVRAVERGLYDLEAYALRAGGREIDPGAITVETRRIPDGRVSVNVAGDLRDRA